MQGFYDSDSEESSHGGEGRMERVHVCVLERDTVHACLCT